jgi:DNA-binding response OmpR family regulator
MIGTGSEARAGLEGAFSERIFVAEYDDATRERIVEALIEDGHDVIGVEDGIQLIECLEIICRDGFREPDLIAMDVSMPSGSGIDLLEELRAAGWMTPVLLMGAFTSPELATRIERAGAAALIVDPFNRRELRASVRSVTHRPASTASPSRLAQNS